MPTLGVPMFKRGMGGPMNVLPIMAMVKSGMGGPMNVLPIMPMVKSGMGGPMNVLPIMPSRVKGLRGDMVLGMMPKGKLRDVMLSRVNEELRG